MKSKKELPESKDKELKNKILEILYNNVTAYRRYDSCYGGELKILGISGIDISADEIVKLLKDEKIK